MFQKIEKRLLALLRQSVLSAFPDPALSPKLHSALDQLTLELPKEKEFGDFSCSIAMKLASVVRKSPKIAAEEVVLRLVALSSGSEFSGLVDKAEVKGIGFVNIFLRDDVYRAFLEETNAPGARPGAYDMGNSAKVLLEFVSANPTGSLSIAHARQAAVGDALANVLFRVGYNVTREYYLNDAGNQINILGRSIDLRYQELAGHAIDFPEDHYQGSYISDLARVLYDDPAERSKIDKLAQEPRATFFRDYGTEKILAAIRQELDGFGVHFDIWYSQRKLDASGLVEETLEALKQKGYIYEAEGAVWFKSTAFGDDKDRVVRKSDGAYTYLAPDIAYHGDKFKRGFEKLINIWGPDHHGYIPRMRAAVQAMGHEADALSVIIVQLATLFRGGQPVPMSTRKGQYVTLTELLSEVGRDAGRFFFLMRKTDSHLDFDLELAKKQTSENPVYYVQYAHARICGILSAGAFQATNQEPDLSLLREPEERDLMKALFGYAYCLLVCAKQLDPYALTGYLQSLASAFHKFYDKHKVLSEDPAMTRARLYLVRAAKNILADGLALMGVSAPERM